MTTTKKKATKSALTFRVSPTKRKELDRVANRRDAELSVILNEAVDQYLAQERYELEQIKEGLRQAEAGNFATEGEVRAAFARFGS